MHEHDELAAGELDPLCQDLQLLRCLRAGSLALESQCAHNELKSEQFLANGVVKDLGDAHAFLPEHLFYQHRRLSANTFCLGPDGLCD